MKKISKMTYDNFIIYGEVDEQLPLYTDSLDTVYSLAGDNETISPNYEIRAINNSVSTLHGNSSVIQAINNVSINNGHMNFNGNSEIQLTNHLFNSKSFEFEIKFKLNEIPSSTINLLACISGTQSNYQNELALIIDGPCRCAYIDTKVQMVTKPDIANTTKYSITDSGAFNKDTWYTLKFNKQSNVATIHINDMLSKVLIYKNNFNCDYISLGQGLKGVVEYIKISTDDGAQNNATYNISNDNLLNSFTLGFYWTPDIVGIYDIASICNFKFSSNMNFMSVLFNNVEEARVSVIEDNTYYISMAYNKTSGQINVYIFNQTNNTLLANITKALSVTSNTIQIKNDKSIYDLAIYKTCLEEKFILRNVKRNFSINKNGDIRYNIDEEDLGFRLKNYYHLPLSLDLNSTCNTINNNQEVYLSEESVKSGIYEADDIIDLIDLDVATLTSANWNNDLHKNAYKIPGWDNGYNDGVTNPQIGYHAKWVTEYTSPESMVLKFTNCNSDFNLANRMLRSARIIEVNELWNKCKVNDKLLIIFEAKSDMPCDIQVGIYRSQKSTGSYGFGNNLKTIKVENSSWTQYCYETTIDSDWDLTKNARLYFYGHLTDRATSCIKTVHLIRNGAKASLETIQDKVERSISIPFKDQIGLSNSNMSILYSTKLSTNKDMINTIKDIQWGIKNNELFIKATKENKVAIKQIQMDEWMTIGLSITSSSATVFLGTKQGVYECSITGLSLTANNIGNIVLDNNNCCLYKNLFISKQNITRDDFETYHRTKLSYYKNLLVLNNGIEESNI